MDELFPVILGLGIMSKGLLLGLVSPGFCFPFVLDCHNYYELMVAQVEGRSPMTSSDAEMDSKPIIIINIFLVNF